MSYGDDDLVMIRSRIANALNIQNGDKVKFIFDETEGPETFSLTVKIRDDLCSDVLIHDLFGL